MNIIIWTRLNAVGCVWITLAIMKLIVNICGWMIKEWLRSFEERRLRCLPSSRGAHYWRCPSVVAHHPMINYHRLRRIIILLVRIFVGIYFNLTPDLMDGRLCLWRASVSGQENQRRKFAHRNKGRSDYGSKEGAHKLTVLTKD